MKVLGKNEKKPVSEKKSPWNIVSGIVAGLAMGILLSVISNCYNGHWIGYTIAAALIIFCSVFGYWVGKNGGLKLLYHEDVYYRIGGYVAFGLILLLCTWAVFFFLIKKDSLMSDSFIVQKFFKPAVLPTIGPWGAKTFGDSWKMFGQELKVADVIGTWGNVFLLTLKYFLNHLVFVIPFIFVMNFFKVGKWNLSVIYFALFTMMWGAAVGTSSLSFPAGDNAMAGPIIIFARYGLWIWFSYLLLMASTTQFACFAAPNWLSWVWKKERKFWPVSFTPDQREVFIYGLLFLLAASFAEARIFVYYNI